MWDVIRTESHPAQSRADTYVATTGSQNISFQFSSDDLVQRIDRRFIPSGKQWSGDLYWA